MLVVKCARAYFHLFFIKLTLFVLLAQKIYHFFYVLLT
nr:MAG TPA: hypothetical protein [Caudoviricetes sp.]